jgi:hypothetical protein
MTKHAFKMCVEIRLDGRNYQVRLDDEKKMIK